MPLESPLLLAPLLLAKSWALYYSLTFLGVLLGALAVLIPSLRKTLKKE